MTDLLQALAFIRHCIPHPRFHRRCRRCRAKRVRASGRTPLGKARNPGGWLATVTARLAIDRARAFSRQRESYVGVWLPEPLVEADDPLSVTRLADDLAIGFLHVLERLGPEERTALLLHDVFDYSHAEVAGMLEKSEEAVRQLASRARNRVREDRPRISVDREKATQLADRFVEALRDGT